MAELNKVTISSVFEDCVLGNLDFFKPGATEPYQSLDLNVSSIPLDIELPVQIKSPRMLRIEGAEYELSSRGECEHLYTLSKPKSHEKTSKIKHVRIQKVQVTPSISWLRVRNSQGVVLIDTHIGDNPLEILLEEGFVIECQHYIAVYDLAETPLNNLKAPRSLK